MDKHKIISDMCMTMDHRYFASPEMFANDPVNKNFTQDYKDGLYLKMKQLFENNIEPILNQFTCSKNERAFLDEIREKFMVCEDGSLGLKSEDYSSMLDQSDFEKCKLKRLVNERT